MDGPLGETQLKCQREAVPSSWVVPSAKSRPAQTLGRVTVASIDKRPNGSWRARWREYPGGPQRTRQFARKVDAERHLVKVQHDLMAGGYVDPAKARTTIDELYAVWSARQPWRESSRSSVAT